MLRFTSSQGSRNLAKPAGLPVRQVAVAHTEFHFRQVRSYPVYYETVATIKVFRQQQIPDNQVTLPRGDFQIPRHNFQVTIDPRQTASADVVAELEIRQVNVHDAV